MSETEVREPVTPTDQPVQTGATTETPELGRAQTVYTGGSGSDGKQQVGETVKAKQITMGEGREADVPSNTKNIVIILILAILFALFLAGLSMWMAN